MKVLITGLGRLLTSVTVNKKLSYSLNDCLLLVKPLVCGAVIKSVSINSFD
jgi:hypothetical protein